MITGRYLPGEMQIMSNGRDHPKDSSSLLSWLLTSLCIHPAILFMYVFIELPINA